MPGTSISDLDLSVSLSEVLDELRDEYTVLRRSPQTINIFNIHITNLIKHLALDGVTTIEAVRAVHVTSFLRHEMDRGLAPASISVILRTMRRYFQFAVEHEHIASNPAKVVKGVSVTIEPPMFLTDAQVATLLKAIPTKGATLEDVRDAAMLRVLASGMRRGELMGLRVTDVDLDTKTLTIRAVTSKTRHGRPAGISTDAKKHLAHYLKVREAYLRRNGRQDDGALWIGAKGTLSANGALQALRRRLRAAGLPQVSLHSFRHKFAAEWIAAGKPSGYLNAAGGWSRNSNLPTHRYGQYGIEQRALDVMREHLDR